MFDIIDSVTKRSRWALADCIDHILDRCTVRINPGFFTKFEYRAQIVRAVAGMGTNPTVVVDRNLLTNIILTFVKCPVRRFIIGEAVFSMCAITERFVIGTATAA